MLTTARALNTQVGNSTLVPIRWADPLVITDIPTIAKADPPSNSAKQVAKANVEVRTDVVTRAYNGREGTTAADDDSAILKRYANVLPTDRPSRANAGHDPTDDMIDRVKQVGVNRAFDKSKFLSHPDDGRQKDWAAFRAQLERNPDEVAFRDNWDEATAAVNNPNSLAKPNLVDTGRGYFEWNIRGDGTSVEMLQESNRAYIERRDRTFISSRPLGSAPSVQEFANMFADLAEVEGLKAHVEGFTKKSTR
jgi:hypothetical protein